MNHKKNIDELSNNSSSLPNEEWRDVVGFEGRYMVSNLSRLKGKKYGKPFIIKKSIERNKCYVVKIWNGKNATTLFVDSVVIKAFVPNPDNKKFIIHKDGNKLNNNSDNLEWSEIRDCQTKYPKELREQVINDYLNGKNTTELEKKHKISSAVIRNWILKSGNNMRTTSSYSKVSDITSKSIIKDFKENTTVKDLSFKYEYSKRCITDLLEANGIDFRIIRPEMKEQAIDLYVNKNLNCCEISKIIGVSNRSILDWVKEAGVNRSMSETSCILALKGKKKHHGIKSIVETKFGKLRCDSSYESKRVRQLDSDKNIKLLSRCKLRIPYLDKLKKKHHYNPDFFIEMNDGSLIIEEVKPKNMLNKSINPYRHKAAEEFCKKNGYIFRIVTEDEIFETIKNE